MKQEEINIAKLLKDTPRGTHLYSPICGECELVEVEKHNIIQVLKGSEKYSFFEDGKKWNEGECLLFPSKDVRDWGCFNVKYAKGAGGRGEAVKALLETNGGIDEDKYNYETEKCIYFIDRIDNCIKCYADYEDNTGYTYILSTGTELKLEEEKSKFKVGDVVVHDNVISVVVECPGLTIKPDITLSYVKTLEKTHENIRLATPKEITEWNKDVLEPNHLHYSKSKRKIIYWFLPFDRIIERYKDDDGVGEWTAGIFSHYSKKNQYYPYGTLCGFTDECLPYNEGTAKLIGTTDDYKEE